MLGSLGTFLCKRILVLSNHCHIVPILPYTPGANTNAYWWGLTFSHLITHPPFLSPRGSTLGLGPHLELHYYSGYRNGWRWPLTTENSMVSGRAGPPFNFFLFSLSRFLYFSLLLTITIQLFIIHYTHPFQIPD